MYRCESCDNLSRPGEKSNRVVVEVRAKTYKDKEGYEEGVGHETVREKVLCHACATQKTS